MLQVYNGPTLLHTLDNVPVTSSAVADKGGQVFSVIAYGAKGDGTTDDTAAIQSTLNAARNIGMTLAASRSELAASVKVQPQIQLRTAKTAVRLTVAVGGTANH